MDLNELSTRLRDVRERRLQTSALLGELEKEEKCLERDLLAILQETGMDRADANGLKMVRVTEQVATPDPEHWSDIFGWITDTANWQLVRKQLNITAVRELAQAGVTIPFVGISDVEKLKVTALRA